jgi:hypothetical protein
MCHSGRPIANRPQVSNLPRNLPHKAAKPQPFQRADKPPG